jgi:hypothetical protein
MKKMTFYSTWKAISEFLIVSLITIFLLIIYGIIFSKEDFSFLEIMSYQAIAFFIKEHIFIFDRGEYRHDA